MEQQALMVELGFGDRPEELRLRSARSPTEKTDGADDPGAAQDVQYPCREFDQSAESLVGPLSGSVQKRGWSAPCLATFYCK